METSDRLSMSAPSMSPTSLRGAGLSQGAVPPSRRCRSIASLAPALQQARMQIGAGGDFDDPALGPVALANQPQLLRHRPPPPRFRRGNDLNRLISHQASLHRQAGRPRASITRPACSVQGGGNAPLTSGWVADADDLVTWSLGGSVAQSTSSIACLRTTACSIVSAWLTSLRRQKPESGDLIADERLQGIEQSISVINFDVRPELAICGQVVRLFSWKAPGEPGGLVQSEAWERWAACSLADQAARPASAVFSDRGLAAILLT